MNLKEPFVITVSREIGSGGHTVGHILAERLGVPYYDKALVESLKEKFSIGVYDLEKLKGKKSNWLAKFLDSAAPLPADARQSISTEEIFKAEEEILLSMAEAGSCVIAGRSGFHVLRSHPNSLHVFITASDEFRVRRVMAKQGLPEESAAALIKDIDDKRENYIKRFTGKSRYDVHNYDIVLKADGRDEAGLAQIILSYIGE